MGCLVNKGITVKNRKRNLCLLQNPICKYPYMEDHIKIKETQLKIISTEVEKKEIERTNNYLEDGLEDSKIDIEIILDKLEKVEEIKRFLEIQSMMEKKETYVQKDKLERIYEVKNQLKNTLARK